MGALVGEVEFVEDFVQTGQTQRELPLLPQERLDQSLKANPAVHHALLGSA
jgi:hypothetical protein